MFIGYTIEIV